MAITIYKLVREAVIETDYSDPGDIAQYILKSLNRSEQLELLIQVLRSSVSEVLSSQRSYISRQGTSKWEGVTRSLLDQPIFTGTEWKRLADCTRDDVISIALIRKDMANEIMAVSEQYNLLAIHMAKTKAKTVGELDGEIIQNIFS